LEAGKIPYLADVECLGPLGLKISDIKSESLKSISKKITNVMDL